MIFQIARKSENIWATFKRLFLKNVISKIVQSSLTDYTFEECVKKAWLVPRSRNLLQICSGLPKIGNFQSLCRNTTVYITLEYITLVYITLVYITLEYITLVYITLCVYYNLHAYFSLSSSAPRLTRSERASPSTSAKIPKPRTTHPISLSIKSQFLISPFV